MSKVQLLACENTYVYYDMEIADDDVMIIHFADGTILYYLP